MKQVAVFWDLDNTHWTIINHYGEKENVLVNLISKIYGHYSDDKIRICRAYADFDKVRNVATDIQRNKVTPKHVFSSGSGTNRKNAGDIELSLDALETALKHPEIKEFVIISADKDMIPLMNRLNYYDKYVHLIYLEAAIANDKLVLNFANQQTSIESLLNLETPSAEIDFSIYIESAKEMVSAFYARNIQKPHLYVGKPMFCQEMAKREGIANLISEKLFDYCIEEEIFFTKQESNGSISVRLRQEEMIN
ncbi:MAG: NYN domain-containing protein [Bacillota bacterium]